MAVPTSPLDIVQLEALGYPAEICENVRLLIERAENAEAEVTRLRGVLEQIADIPGTLHRDMCSKKARAVLADKQLEPQVNGFMIEELCDRND